MTGQSIIYLGKEWGQLPTSCDHVFHQLARHNRVLWVNSIATRNPNLTSAADWKRIFSKLRKVLGGLRQVGPSAWVYQPAVIPLPFSETARRLNRALLSWSLRRQARKLDMSDPQLWMFHPNGAYLVGHVDESLVVYYCVDEWSEFTHLEGVRLAELERELLRKADVCFVVSEPLAATKKQQNPNTHLVLHGVDFAHFARALDPATEVPADVAGLRGPVVGFFGALHDWIDQELLAKAAQAHPEWSIVLIGKAETALDRLAVLPNVKLLGKRPYESLPGYCKAFSVGLIPFHVNELTRNVNPIKLREYLSAGLDVVSTDMPEVRRYDGLVRVARDHSEFIAAIEAAIREDSPEARRRRSESMRAETWEEKVREVGETVMKARAKRTGQ